MLAGLFVAVMAVLAVVRGVLRLIRGMLKLAIGFALGVYVFLKAPEWLDASVANPSTALLGGLSVVAGVIGHVGSGFALEKVLGGLDSAQATGRSMSMGKAVLLSLLPSGALIWMAGVLLRLGGSFNGMAQVDLGAEAARPWLAEARAFLNQGAVGRVFNVLDPVTPPEVAHLCELLVAYRDPAHWKAVKADPSLQTVLNHAKFRRLLNDREVKFVVAHSNYARLLTLPEVRTAAEDPDLAAALRSARLSEVRRAEPVP